MYSIKIEKNNLLNESIYSTKLDNGLDIYICKKEGFEKKIGMFGTKYGSIDNDFIDITTGNRIKVPDGVAHFLEHKLFEKEGANALDLFSKKGVTSNAYTTFDHTVFFFETIEKFEESVALLINLVKVPYFTDENVEKEKGIIGQEISMYNDDPNFVTYFNTLRAVYKEHPVRIDIAGTIESIAAIDKEVLYTCYNTFYSPQNMFYLVVGDVDVEKTIDIIENEMKKYDMTSKDPKAQIQKFEFNESLDINKKEIVQEMDIYMPQLCIGYKLDTVKKEEILKRELISEFIYEMYFSKLSAFHKEKYNEGLINSEVSFQYESGSTFSHAIISGSSTKIEELKQSIIEYMKKIKEELIDESLFETIKRKKIGERISDLDNLGNSYRLIIDNILNENGMYKDIEVLENLTKEDISKFLNILNDDRMVVSIVINKK